MAIALVTVSGLIMGCRTAPITGRRQLLLVSESEEKAMGLSSFQQTLASEQLSTNAEWTEMVNRVGRRLAAVARRPDYEWEFRLIASPEQNAFALPGGKVAIYEGILPICGDEAGLAVVMSHEVSHALARHGAERISQGYVVNGVGTVISSVTQARGFDRTQALMQGYGLASQYGYVLPFSRKHETEADHMGIILMAQAGYDPRAAPRFWQRFSQAKSAQYTPEFLSTHPNDERRAEDLLGHLSEAIAIYDQAPQKFGHGAQIAWSGGSATSPLASTQRNSTKASLGEQVPGDWADSKASQVVSSPAASFAMSDSSPDGSSRVQQAAAQQPVSEPTHPRVRLPQPFGYSNPLR